MTTPIKKMSQMKCHEDYCQTGHTYPYIFQTHDLGERAYTLQIYSFAERKADEKMKGKYIGISVGICEKSNKTDVYKII